MRKPVLLDLFCGAGGCAVGYARAGFEVVGVDSVPQPCYPYHFVQADALDFPLDGGDVIHASPPCQLYSVTWPIWQRDYPEIVPLIRARLWASGKPFVIENVVGAPLPGAMLLCGTMFGLGVLRHRLFESNVLLFAPGDCQHRGTVKQGQYISVFGKGGNGYTKERGSEAMGIDWMTVCELSQAIPPVYTEWIGWQMMRGWAMMGVALDLVEVYASLFVHCWDHYAVQQRDGSYWRMDESLTLSLLTGHLVGRWTLGTYLLDRASCCAFAVFDADSADGLAQLGQLSIELAGQGLPTLLEASRRGGHLWVHFMEPTPASLVHAWLLPYAVAYGVEFYPKQEVLPMGGCGSLIRLPLGVHWRSRGWYPFVQMASDGRWMPVGKTVWDCCAWVMQSVQRVALPETVSMMAVVGSGVEEIPYLPAPMASYRSGSYPGQGSIRAWCRAHDILAVIGRHVVLDDRGVGSCPFKEHHRRGDMRPSFQVFGDDDPHWYCYTWGRAGDLFDFFCLYYHLSHDEAWRRIQEGTLG